jgi:hypothetical protein
MASLWYFPVLLFFFNAIAPYSRFTAVKYLYVRTLINGAILLIMRLVRIEATCSLEGFRKYIIFSTCKSFIPESYLQDFEVFPEREEGPGAIYIEAADKVTLKKMREITFVNAKEILGIIYSSKSGNTQLRWRQTRRKTGKVSGNASPNALVNLVESGVITQEWTEEYLKSSQVKKDETTSSDGDGSKKVETAGQELPE